MGSILVHKDNIPIESVEDWFRLAPPKEGLRQWKDGRSAKELAKSWFPEPGKPQIPPDLISLLNSHPDLIGTEIIEGTPEHKIPLDNFRGETRNADLVLVGKKDEAKISINIEAKADEPYDQIISEKLRLVNNSRSKIPDRVNLMCQALFGSAPVSNAELLNLRYQLLTGCAGALIEASRVDAQIAVFVVHVFISGAVNPEKVQSNDMDYMQFLRCLWPDGCNNFADGVLVGPISVTGGRFVPSDVPLYVGKIKTVVTWVS